MSAMTARAALTICLMAGGWCSGCTAPPKSPPPPQPPATQPEPAAATQPGAAGRPGWPATQADLRPVRFFDIADRAGRVVFLIDGSGSMFMTFAYVKAELIRAIRALAPEQQFQAVFFSDGPPKELVIDARPGLHAASARNKQAASDWIDGQWAGSKSGQTDARPSLERAIRIPGGPPDLIYLLTDGLLAEETAAAIERLNPDRRVRINAILFRDRTAESEGLLKRIARENGGRYVFVPEEKFRDWPEEK